MKKWMLPLGIAGVLTLSACNAGSSDVVVKTDAGDITKDELYQSMKDKYGEQAVQELVYKKVLSKKYKVTDEEVDKKLKELKEELGENFELVLQQNNLKNEKELKKVLKDQIMMEKAAMKDIKVSEKDIKKSYDEYKPDIKASHILVEAKDEKLINEIKAKLDKGEKFEGIAKEFSKDPGSAQNGGDLGYFGPGKMVPEFEKAAYSLKVGEISKPVKTEMGWHIIKLTDKKEKKSYDEMKDKLEYDLKLSKVDPQKMQQNLQDEVKAADVKIKDKDLKDALKTNSQPQAQ
ncbi:peptidylprolyl isomerase [Bacillus massilinigeriensis]|uniref:peptidylprolyl isomerase n=1 Tax=Bacillus mediterraneensis TaxID=1805474 RepID=UPI0008F889B3|nr:peptidylprolyl isomerase [Bacillus mediterraneensis]